jgi:sugar O-acyltransferase (sialic acid O-acetyltransferase NeuD family)
MISNTRKIEVVLIGAGGHGSELHSYLADLAETSHLIQMLGFLDDNMALRSRLGDKLLGGLQELEAISRRNKKRSLKYITAIGDNLRRLQIVRRINELGLPNLQPWTLRHPTAQTGRDVEIGDGTLLAPNVILTTRIRIGAHCIFNVRVSVSHDCQIGNFVNINPAAILCGNVIIGDGSYIGAGAVVKEKIRIGRGVTVGAGAVVVRDLPDNVIAVGVPARVIKTAPGVWPDSGF